MSKLFLLGCDPELTPGKAALLISCRTAFAPRRLRPALGDFSGSVYPVTPLPEALEQMADELQRGDIAVLTGGDPLFFGIGRRLIELFGPDLIIHPALSAPQTACARFLEPWDDACFISLHGRDDDNFAARILRRPKTIVFTDHRRTPALIAQRLLETGAGIGIAQENIVMMIAEDLGTPKERLTKGCPREIAEMRFSTLNIVIIKHKRPPPTADFVLGLNENNIRHSRGLITKDEVRAATLHHLRLPKQGVLWDIGAGSGSISLEAARLCPELRIFAVERQPEEQDNITANIRRYQSGNITLVKDQAPEALKSLPRPERIFIGGSGGRLTEIINFAAAALAPQGIMVVNAVISSTRDKAPALLHQAGMRVQTTTIQVSRAPFPPETDEIINFKPITIITGKK